MIGAVRYGDEDSPNRIAIAVCTLGAVRAEWWLMSTSAAQPLGTAQAFVTIIGETIEDARNLAAAYAETGGWEYLMFWDDDVVPHKLNAVEYLLETMDQNDEIDILGGVYPARTMVPIPIVYQERGGKVWWGWENGHIHRVWMTGTGFTVYRMSSLKKLNPTKKEMRFENGKVWHMPRYFRMEGNVDDYQLAIDAEKAGLSWYVHGGVTADQMELSGKRYRFEDAKQRIEVPA